MYILVFMHTYPAIYQPSDQLFHLKLVGSQGYIEKHV